MKCGNEVMTHNTPFVHPELREQKEGIEEAAMLMLGRPPWVWFYWMVVGVMI
jgi:hypothetical protein